jgi:hypothetical protein
MLVADVNPFQLQQLPHPGLVTLGAAPFEDDVFEDG